MEQELGLSGGQAPDFHIPPPDTSRPTSSEGFEGGLLRREARGEVNRGSGAGLAVGGLALRIDPAKKPIPEPFE